MQHDEIDAMLAAWRQARPDLDASPLALVGRVLVLAQHLERRVNTALAKHELTLGQFDILATLRRQLPEHQLTPKQLMQSVMLSSGGMTNRLDRLEQAGWIRRDADPADRRGIVVTLTKKGLKVIDAATATRFAEAQAVIPTYSTEEQRVLIGLLREWLLKMHADPS